MPVTYSKTPRVCFGCRRRVPTCLDSRLCLGCRTRHGYPDSPSPVERYDPVRAGKPEHPHPAFGRKTVAA